MNRSMCARGGARLGLIAVRVTAAAALAGLAVGLIRHVWVVFENDYLAQGLHHLAARTLAEGSWAAAATGARLALATLAGVLALWPLARLRAGSWPRAGADAWAAVAVLAAYGAGGLYLNRHFLPGFFELPSVAANLGWTALAASVWWGLSGGLRRLVEAPPAWTARLPGAIALLTTLGIALMATRALPLAAPPRLERPGPNVVLILIDALRPDRLGVYGYERDTSPHLDALAAESWVFTEAVAPAPWTKPSVASLFTSLYPSGHGIGTRGWTRAGAGDTLAADALHPELQTLAELLANAGFRTAAFGENHHLVPRFGFDQGFQRYELRLTGPDYRSSVEVLPRFREWLEGGTQGLFAYLHFIDVHFPYLPPAPYVGQWAGPPPELDYNTVEFMNWAQKRERDGPLELDPDVARHMSDSYDEEIRFLDEQIGKLVGDLKTRGVYDGALLIVTSDHGEEFLEHGEIAHGTSLHDVLLRIPLIVKFPCPGPRCGHRVVERQVELLDLMPTVLERVGLPVPDAVRGRSLLRAPGAGAERVALAEYGERVSLRTLQFKYIAPLEGEGGELYDLRADPAERRNLAPRRPDLVAAFQARLESWREAVRRGPVRGPATVSVDPETRKALEALGYVQ